jgi:5-methylcytosine-specific restriction protein A
MFTMTPGEDIAFTEFLLQKAAEAEGLGYRPALFKQMLAAQGGEAAVRQLLGKGKPSDGFARLWELGRLDLTVEALVVETKWRRFFDPVLVQQAERLLSKSGYAFTRYSPAAVADVVDHSEAGGTRPAEAALPAAPPRPSRRRNSRSFSAFCAYLGAPLANAADRWCGYNPERSLAVFTLWADRLHDGRYILWDAAARSDDNRIGAKELRRVLDALLSTGHVAYGIRCEPRDAGATPRERGYFDEDQVLVLGLEAEGANVVARVLGATSAADVAAGRRGPIGPFESAIDDLGFPPPGNSAPARTAAGGGGGYRRDSAVRDYVIRRSRGHCEYCGALGFELVDGSHYVEAHHVIALSAEGPDTVENVIALCPEHHREAHYGKQAEALESALLTKLREIAKGLAIRIETVRGDQRPAK